MRILSHVGAFLSGVGRLLQGGAAWRREERARRPFCVFCERQVDLDDLLEHTEACSKPSA